jgi:hypothetical protein
VKEKKNRRFGVCMEDELALTIKKFSSQSKLSMGKIIRYCVDRQLANPDYLQALSRAKKSTQVHLVFEESQIKKLSRLADETGLSIGEIVRLCLARQLAQMRREGGFKLRLEFDAQ